MSALAFDLPDALEAREPPEARGLARDQVRLLVARQSTHRITHATFRDLPGYLTPGDLLVINVSRTLPAAVPGHRQDGSKTRVHFSTRAPHLDQSWRIVELRSADGSRPARGRSGEHITLKGGADLTLVAPYATGQRLMLAHMDVPLEDYLSDHGEPIRYGYVANPYPLDAYQNVYATTPGSAEMPSAGRPFTHELLNRIQQRNIHVAPITLHCGVSSPERHEPPFPEYFEVPHTTAKALQKAHRVIAVGTTVVRALETTGGAAGSGWTNHIVTPSRPPTTVDGLITGWHEPEASHLQMLEAIAGPDLLRRSYAAAIANRYLWHEFGDSHLILP
jgi:S-adenosylmethionine:tRNA ribosyltransferase-isomerase